MFETRLIADARHVLEALSRSQAVVEFDLDGNIITANENFCKTLGYSLGDIVGRHHRMFCDPSLVATPAYLEFWQRLGAGSFDAGIYRRIRKDGKGIWVQATYNPVSRRGKPYKITKFASDITLTHDRALEDAAKISALSKSQAVIEFTPSGEIISANENFCRTLGYEESEIVGRHHRIFCRSDYARTAEYASFWEKLGNGEFVANEFVRVAKSGREVWIQAAYNPIFNAAGKVEKVVKFATDVTERMSAIRDISSAMKEIAQGNLTQTLDRAFVPSMEELRSNFNKSVSQLCQTMEQIGRNVDTIADGSQEISANADDLSKRSEQQAASLEETAAALEEITTTVADTSNRAEVAGRLVSETKKNAELSGVVVENAVAAMSEIQRSSDEISNILGVIDEIAFQTNLLALNAGVEAARAGDAGKGFAVVAQEVRELAQRSAKAAKDIKALIIGSNTSVSNGVELVGRMGASLKLIVAQVGEINTNVEAIVVAAREQTVGLTEINVAVNSMDQVTQRNAAMAEESTAASNDLASQTVALRALLARFKTVVAGRPGSDEVSAGYAVRSPNAA